MSSELDLNVGVCIYCGDAKSPLTREHILPRGLGGNWEPEGHSDAFVLQKATCERCRLITEKIERESLRPTMDPARARLGLKRKDRIAKISGWVDLPDGSTEHRDMDPSEILGALVLPSYYEAGALTNKPLTDTAPCDLQFFVIAPASRRLLEEAARVGVELFINPKVFGQMLAKIALGVAVAQFGVTGFEPTVRNFILNNPNECGCWVGGFAGTQRAEPASQALHSTYLRTERVGSNLFIIVEIRLFAEFGGPTNYVIVGRLG